MNEFIEEYGSVLVYILFGIMIIEVFKCMFSFVSQ